MRVAFVGKGGAGKSAIAGTFARALARRGEPVLTIDSDPMPGLAFSLGLEREDTPMPEDTVVERQAGEEGPRFRLRPGLTALDAIEQFAATGPDGVRFLQFGKLRGHSAAIQKSQFAFMQIIDQLPDDLPWSVVGDLPGGTRQPFAGWGDYAHTFIAVIEPTAKSMLAGRRLARLAARPEGPARIVAVANKVREEGDAELVARRTGLRVIGSVPYDEDFAEAERRALAPIDHAPNSLAVGAVESLVSQLCEERQP
jgi:CO dehydrogenase maturation factor